MKRKMNTFQQQTVTPRFLKFPTQKVQVLLVSIVTYLRGCYSQESSCLLHRYLCSDAPLHFNNNISNKMLLPSLNTTDLVLSDG